jgi:hypothetical protein
MAGSAGEGGGPFTEAKQKREKEPSSKTYTLTPAVKASGLSLSAKKVLGVGVKTIGRKLSRQRIKVLSSALAVEVKLDIPLNLEQSILLFISLIIKGKFSILEE